MSNEGEDWMAKQLEARADAEVDGLPTPTLEVELALADIYERATAASLTGESKLAFFEDVKKTATRYPQRITDMRWQLDQLDTSIPPLPADALEKLS